MEQQCMEEVRDLMLAPAPPARERKRGIKYSEARFNKKLKKLGFEAVECLEQILTDPAAKAADRISAAKLALDVAARREPADDEPGTVRVIFEGIPPEYAE